MLNPVSQLSLAIRENTEQLTEKIKWDSFAFHTMLFMCAHLFWYTVPCESIHTPSFFFFMLLPYIKYYNFFSTSFYTPYTILSVCMYVHVRMYVTVQVSSSHIFFSGFCFIIKWMFWEKLKQKSMRLMILHHQKHQTRCVSRFLPWIKCYQVLGIFFYLSFIEPIVMLN